jgi:2TM domain
MSDEKSSDAEFRKLAEKSIKKKREAWQFLFVAAIVNIGLHILWFFNEPRGYYWPGWVLFGMGLGVITTFYDAFFKPVKLPISDAEIDEEIVKLKRRQR